MADRMGSYMHAHTLYGSYRPFGSAVIIASHDLEGYHLHMVEPSGHNYVIFMLFMLRMSFDFVLKLFYHIKSKLIIKMLYIVYH